MPHLQLNPSTLYYMTSRSKDDMKINSKVKHKHIYLISVFKGALTRRVFRAKGGILLVVPRL